VGVARLLGMSPQPPLRDARDTASNGEHDHPDPFGRQYSSDAGHRRSSTTAGGDGRDRDHDLAIGLPRRLPDRSTTAAANNEDNTNLSESDEVEPPSIHMSMGQSHRRTPASSARTSDWLAEATARGAIMCNEAPPTNYRGRQTSPYHDGAGYPLKPVSADGRAVLAGHRPQDGYPFGGPDYPGENPDDNYSEVNEEDEIIASSFIDSGTREYTKLEVMSAKEIRCVVNFFYTFVVLGFIVSIATIAFSLAKFRLHQPVLVPVQSLLSEAQYREGLYQYVKFVKGQGAVMGLDPPPANSPEGTASGRSGPGASPGGTSGGGRASTGGAGGSTTGTQGASSPTRFLLGSAWSAHILKRMAANGDSFTGLLARESNRFSWWQSFGNLGERLVVFDGLSHSTLSSALSFNEFMKSRDVRNCDSGVIGHANSGLACSPRAILRMYARHVRQQQSRSSATYRVAVLSNEVFHSDYSTLDGSQGVNHGSVRGAAAVIPGLALSRPVDRQSGSPVPSTNGGSSSATNTDGSASSNGVNPAGPGAKGASGGRPAGASEPGGAGGRGTSPKLDTDDDVRAYATKLANEYIAAGRGPDSPFPFSFATVSFLNRLPSSENRGNQAFLAFNIAASSFMASASLFAFLLALIFIVRIVRLGRKHITHEQIWAACLLILTGLYWSFFYALSRLNSIMSNKPFLPASFDKVTSVAEVLRMPAFTGIVFFYVWASLHTYRILDPTQHLRFVSFYLPKFAVLGPFVLVKALARSSMELRLSEVPLISVVAFAKLLSRFQVWRGLRPQLVYLLCTTVMEIVIVGIIATEAVKTSRALRRAKYSKYRTKQIGFRFFAFLNITLFSALFLNQLLLLFTLPAGETILPLVLGHTEVRITDEWIMGSAIMMLGYVIAESYVKLPKSAVGIIKGWFVNSKLAESSSRWSTSSQDSVPSRNGPGAFDEAESLVLRDHYVRPEGGNDTKVSSKPPIGGRSTEPAFHANMSPERALNVRRKQGTLFLDDTDGSSSGLTSPPESGNAMFVPKGPLDPAVDHDLELENEIREPVTYRMHESRKHLELKANCFTMQTHVMMFNFAWYVYYYGTPKAKRVHPKDDAFRFEVSKHISQPDTDTHVLVIDGQDRIVVAFKGTTSMRNMQTSIQSLHESLINIIPSGREGEIESKRLKTLFKRVYETAKVHKGFAAAYRSVAKEVVSEVTRLQGIRRRPVFLTGHSLGGALATLCSMDLWITAGLSRRQIFVSTFGSPRVGNDSFRTVYNKVVPLNWRLVVVSDMIAQLPKGRYRHVGKKVLMTPYGLLLIDPNILETFHGLSRSSGFAYHRKASYMLAMRAWCVRNHGKEFVPQFWPFPVRAEDSRRFQEALSSDNHGEGGNRKLYQNRIMTLDALVDSLVDDDASEADMSVVDLWGRLTRKVLLNITLHEQNNHYHEV
jgi:triacylglycerol lipase